MNEVTKCDLKREDIIRMARSAGLIGLEQGGILENFQRFAALVAAAEREKIAVWMHGRGYATGHGDTVEDMLEEVEWQAAERERLAWHELAGIGLVTKARGET